MQCDYRKMGLKCRPSPHQPWQESIIIIILPGKTYPYHSIIIVINQFQPPDYIITGAEL